MSEGMKSLRWYEYHVEEWMTERYGSNILWFRLGEMFHLDTRSAPDQVNPWKLREVYRRPR